MTRSIFIKTDFGCCTPGIVRALEKAQYDKPTTRKNKPVLTRVGKYVAAHRDPLTRDIDKVFKAHALKVARPIAQAILSRGLKKFDEAEARDDHGRWTTGSSIEPKMKDWLPTTDMTISGYGHMDALNSPAEREMADKAYHYFGDDSSTVADAALKNSTVQKLASEMLGNPAWSGVMDKLVAGVTSSDVSQEGIKFGASYSQVNSFIKAWATSSSDSNLTSQWLQQMAVKEFGISNFHDPQSLDAMGHSQFTKTAEQLSADLIAGFQMKGVTPDELQSAGRAFLRQMYNDTQEKLKGVAHLYLARGISVTHQRTDGAIEDFSLNPISSFAMDTPTAMAFSTEHTQHGVTIYADVPTSRILSFPSTGFGCNGEYEVTVLGGPMRAIVIPTERDKGARAEQIRWAFDPSSKPPPHKLPWQKLAKGVASIDPDGTLRNADWPKWRGRPLLPWSVTKLHKAEVDAPELIELDPDEIDNLVEMLRSEDMSAATVAALREAVIQAYQEAGRYGLAQVGITAITDEDQHVMADMTDQVDAEAVFWAANRGGQLIKDLAGTTDQDLRGLLSRGVEEGTTVDDLAEQIGNLGAFGEVRAAMIATTELAFAHVQGNVEGWRASGEVEQKRWILGDLHEVVDECDDAVDAGTVDLDDDFGDTGLDFPPAHPNCWCDVIPVLKSAPELGDDDGASDDNEGD